MAHVIQNLLSINRHLGWPVLTVCLWNLYFSTYSQNSTQTAKLKPNQTLWQDIFKHDVFCDQKVKYFNDFQNQNFSVLWLKWTRTMEVRQNQISFHGAYSHLTSYLFFIKKRSISMTFKIKILKYFGDF